MLAVPVILIPIVVAALSSPVDGVFWLRALLWTVAVLVYGAIWHGLALVVNARGMSAPANALVLAGIWLLFAVVGPSCVNLLIAVRYPMPSRVEAAVEARAATQEATVQGSQQLGQFLQDHPTTANVGREGMRQFALLQAERDRKVAERLQAVDASFDAQLRKQQRLASWLSVLSPTMVAQNVLLDVAGTSTFRFDHFRAEVVGVSAAMEGVLRAARARCGDADAGGIRGRAALHLCRRTVVADAAARRAADRGDGVRRRRVDLGRLPRLSRVCGVIEAIDLCKTFGAGLAVDHLTLTIQPGEVFCLLGANGAGKTTTINLFLNFIEPTSGQARSAASTSSSIRSRRRSGSPTFPSRSRCIAT